MNRLLISFISCVFPLILNAQVFAFVQNGSGTDNAEAVHSYKYRVANDVFNALLHARGDYRMQAPTLVMNKRERYVAWMDPENTQIGLEEKAYDICVSFGRDSLNALAALLSHELVHYYEKHDWSRHFIRENEKIEAAREVERLEEGLKQEAQADYLGGFLALSVGYNTYGIMPTLLKKLYQGYKLPERLPGYPSLSDRLNMVNGAMASLEELTIMFELAQTMTITGYYENAALYYRSILQRFQSREIYNNAGANSLLAGLNLFSPKEMPYLLPVEMDPETRMRTTRDVSDNKQQRRTALLQTAKQQFQQAISLDEQYCPAYLNLGCAMALLGEFEDAEFWLKKGAKKCTETSIKQDFALMKALVLALQGEKNEAVQLLESLPASNFLVRSNLDVLRGTVAATAASQAAPIGLEQIEAYRLSDFLVSPTVDKEVAVAENVFCGAQKRPQSRILIHYADNGKQYLVAQETLPGYTGKTNKGLTLGASEAQVQQSYGPPGSIVRMPGWEVWVYPAACLYFKFDEKKMLGAWGVYIEP